MLDRLPDRLLLWHVYRVWFLLLADLAIDVPTNKFGEALRAQMEERLNFFEVISHHVIWNLWLK